MKKKARGEGSGRLCLGSFLGTSSALWALFLWTELVRSRSGLAPFCGFGDGSGCAALWDGSFASAVHRLTGLPLAGWGLVWGVVAAGLPLLALSRRQRRDEWVAAVKVHALAGVLGVLILLAVSAREGVFCTSCAGTYVLVGAYALAVVGPRWREAVPPRAQLLRGTVMAGVAVLSVFLLALYPGQNTPPDPESAGERALARALPRGGGSDRSPRPAGSARSEGAADERSSAVSPDAAPPARLDAEREEALHGFVSSLEPPMKQVLSDALEVYRNAPGREPVEPRFLVGEEDAPLRLTEFTDPLCSHCASLHDSLEYLRAVAPPGSFAIEPRHYPLDGTCNPAMGERRDKPIRCLAAKAQICLEGHDEYFELSGAIFENQASLTERRLFRLTSPYVERDALERCVQSPETERKLEEDLRYARRYGIHGTPLVLLNGRQAPAFAPFLYAMILTGGSPEHPVFSSLPPPRRRSALPH